LPRIRASPETLFALRRQSSDDWVVSRNRSDFGSTARGTDLGEKVNVRFVILTPLTRQVIFVVNGFHWANWFASTTIHTFIWVDIEHTITLVNAVDGALIDTCLVLHIYARESDYVGHEPTLL
jgi:hypothetical protein